MRQPTILKRDQVRIEPVAAPDLTVEGADVPVMPAAPIGTNACEKAIRLLEEAGQIRALEVTCSCGEQTVIALEYPEQSPLDQSSNEGHSQES